MDAEIYIDRTAQLEDICRFVEELDGCHGDIADTSELLSFGVIDIAVGWDADVEDFIGAVRRHKDIIDEVDVLPLSGDVPDDLHYFDEFGNEFADYARRTVKAEIDREIELMMDRIEGKAQ